MSKSNPAKAEHEAKAQAEADHKEAVAAIARETMTGDLRDCILDFLKHDKNPLPWNMQGEGAQRETVEKVTKAVQSAVEKVVHIISADARPTIVATLKKVTIGDETKAEVSIGKTNPLRHALFDSQGQEVLIVVTDAAPYEGEKAPVKIDPDQHVLPGTDDEDDDGSVFDNTNAGR